MDNRAIGVIDSGVGGLSVLQHLQQQLPHEDFLYVADSHHAPYGSKSPAFIIERTTRITDYLLSKEIKALVIACNTATAAAANYLREHYVLPIIGMEPAVKPASQATQNGVVGVLATSGTLKSAQFAALLENHGKHIQVVTQACPGLMECVERGECYSETTRALLRSYLQPLVDAGVDVIVLGCTHYPFLRQLITDILATEMAQPHIKLIDTGAAVARQLARVLAQTDKLTQRTHAGSVVLLTNSPHADASQVLHRLWERPANITVLPSVV